MAGPLMHAQKRRRNSGTCLAWTVLALALLGVGLFCYSQGLMGVRLGEESDDDLRPSFATAPPVPPIMMWDSPTNVEHDPTAHERVRQHLSQQRGGEKQEEQQQPPHHAKAWSEGQPMPIMVALLGKVGGVRRCGF